jgi:WD40 repeat protein
VIVTGSGDGTVHVWDPDGDPTKAPPELTGHTAGVQAVAIGRLGDRPVIVAAGGTDQTVRVWDAETHQPRLVLSSHATDAHAVALGEVDGRAMLFVGAQDRVQAVEVLRLPGGAGGPG